MIGLNEKDSQLYIDNVSLGKIAEEFGTPTYVYSASHIRAQYQKLQSSMAKALPKNRQPLLCYACKANSNLAILKLLQNEGAGLEIVSEGELMRGLAAGFDPQKIVSTGVGKQASEIANALEAGIRQFNVESLPELEHIQQIAAAMNQSATVVFRLNPDVSGGGHHKISTGRKRDKFGISREQVFKGFQMAKDMSHIHAVGLSMHIGSQVFTVETFRHAFEKLPEIVAALRAEGHTVSRLDIGGGFPIVYKDEKLLDFDAYATWVNDIIVPLETDIIMEPGRYMVGNSGILLNEVLYIKETADRNFLILDGAMNDLIRPTLYEAYHDIEAVRKSGKGTKTYDIVGPVCETGDTFATDRELPETQAGDLIAIKSAGAYGFSMASNYNTRPLPAEILVDGDEYAVIRPRQTLEECLRNDIIPEFLQK
ncbi:MAG: diaminopimelate decarboxylase [Alphaproteobacteria bacterium]|nr:diaminopimelate decarboxylase [Alphaproteobacteria bacterium]